MYNLDRYIVDVAGVLGRATEKQTGYPVLIFFSDEEEMQLFEKYRADVKPKEAAKLLRPQLFITSS